MIRIALDDLAFLPVDVVLRPATETLEPAAPVAADLDRVGGEALAGGRRLHDGLEWGAAVVTPGGDLTAPFVLHLVIRTDDRPTGREIVQRALTGAWQRAADWGLPRIGTALVGAGPGLLEPREALELLTTTWQEGPASRLEGAELVVVVDTEAERQALTLARAGGEPA